MNAEEFNKKYKTFLEEGHYGLDIHNEEFIEWLDTKFQEFILIPEFKYTQIKSKFGMGRFYCQKLFIEQIKELE